MLIGQIVRKSWQAFHVRLYFSDLFGDLSCRSWSIDEQCRAWLPIHILNYCWIELPGVLFFLAGEVLECNLAHRRSVAVLCKLFKIKSNPMHPLSGALHMLNVPARVAGGALVAHRHSFAPSRCRTSQTVEPFYPSHCLIGTIVVALFLMVWDWSVLRAEPMLSCWLNLLFLFVSYYFLFFFLPCDGCMGLGSSD